MNKKAMTTTIMIVVVLTLVFLILIATGVMPKMYRYFNENIIGKAPNEQIKLPGGGTTGAANFRELKLSADKTTAINQLVDETFTCWSDFATLGQDITLCSRITLDSKASYTITESEYQQALAKRTQKASDGADAADLAGTLPDAESSGGILGDIGAFFKNLVNAVDAAFRPNNFLWRFKTITGSSGTIYTCGHDKIDLATNFVVFTTNKDDCGGWVWS